MLITPHPLGFAEPPLRMEVQTSDQTQAWSVYSLHETPPSGFESGWALLKDLAPEERQRLQRLCAVDSERVFPAVVNNEVCVVIEQEFQASDCGDVWHEDSAQVIGRLFRSLLPRLRAASFVDPSLCGVVANPSVTFCGRPTLMVAIPARTAEPGDVGRLLSEVLQFAYPSLH